MMTKNKYTNYENLYTDDRTIKELKIKAKNEETLKFTVSLRNCLYRKKLNQSDLANLTGISLSTLSPYFTAEAEPKISTLVKIASALGVSVNHLLGQQENETMKNEEIRKTVGLNDNSIKVLNNIFNINEAYRKDMLKKKQMLGLSKPYNYEIDVLNRLLLNQEFVSDFLKILSEYSITVNSKYEYYTNELKEHFTTKILINERRNLLFDLQDLLTKEVDMITNEIIENNKEG